MRPGSQHTGYAMSRRTNRRRYRDPATKVCLAIRVGESYGYTVTTYTETGGSATPAYVFFSLS